MKIRNFIAIGLCSMMLLGCSQGYKGNSEVDAYITVAQNYIDSGDYASATKTLKEGISATDAAALKVMLVDLQNLADADTEPAAETVADDMGTTEAVAETQPPEADEKPDLTEYVGVWVSAFDSLTISIENDYIMCIKYEGLSSSGEAEFDISRVYDEVKFSYTDYFESTPGDITLKFVDGFIEYTTNHSAYDPSSGVFEKYVMSDMTLEVYDRMQDHTAGRYKTLTPTANSEMEIGFEAGNMYIELNVGNGTSDVRFFVSTWCHMVIGGDGSTKWYIKPDTPNGNSATFKLAKSDGWNEEYINYPLGDQGAVTFTFEDDRISYKITGLPETLLEYSGDFLMNTAFPETTDTTYYDYEFEARPSDFYEQFDY